MGLLSKTTADLYCCPMLKRNCNKASLAKTINTVLVACHYFVFLDLAFLH